MSISLGSPFGQFMKILGVAAALFMVGCNQSSVMVGSGESQFCVPAEYAVSTSYPGLWDLSGGDDSAGSLSIRFPVLSNTERSLVGVLHVLSPAEIEQVSTARVEVAQQINDRAGPFAGGQLLEDTQLGGVRAIPKDIDHAYWYLLKQSPPAVSAADVLARCSATTPSRDHWRCYFNVEGKDFIVQVIAPLEEMPERAEVQLRVLELVESWRAERCT